MKPWFMALVFGRRPQLVTLPYTANATVAIPQGVSKLESIVGKGAPGTPGIPGTPAYFVDETTYFTKRNGQLEVVESTSGPFTGNTPSNYCDDGVATPDSQTYVGYQTCYVFRRTSIGGTSATTGASSTGFSQTFVGGTAGAATARTVPNVAVTPGGSYNVVVPSGGSIVISYYL